MNEKTYDLVNDMHAHGMTYEEINRHHPISRETFDIIISTAPWPECRHKYYSAKANKRPKKKAETKEQSVIVTANAYMVDRFRDQTKILETISGQIAELIKMLK